MSAAFSIGDRDFWGTNGAVSTFVERMSHLAGDTPGIDPGLAFWLGERAQFFFTGSVVFLDEALSEPGPRGQFLGLLDQATEELL